MAKKFIFLILLLVIFTGLTHKGKVFIGTYGKGSFNKIQSKLDIELAKIIREPNEEKKDFRISKLIKNYGVMNIENLSRYRSKEVAPVLLRLVDHPEDYIRTKVLYTLREIGDGTVISNLKLLVDEESPVVREYLATIFEISSGQEKFLEDWLTEEENEYVKSTIKTALKNINSKKMNTLNIGGNYTNIETTNLTRLKRLKYYRSGRQCRNCKSPGFRYFKGEKSIPVADRFVPPIQDYFKELVFEPPRISFGVGKGRVHTGDDCGWFREGCSIYAIANGIVRIVGHSSDWGTLLVLEHRLENGDYICSLYGHCSRRVYVNIGDIVKRGEKIAVMGPAYSVENGGYGTHLHFAIHKGRWLQPKYIKGYYMLFRTDSGLQTAEIIDVNDRSVVIKLRNRKLFTIINDDKGIQDRTLWIKGYHLKENGTKGWISPWDFFKEK